MYLKRIIIIGVLSIACTIQAIAQTTNYTKPKKSKFAVYAGFGPNYYFNNLQLGKNFVNNFNYSFTGRIMWEPEHLLSLGIESGYNRLYTFNTPQPNQVHIANSAVPLLIVVSMKVSQALYVNFSMGQSILHNNIHTEGKGDLNSTNISIADFSGTFGYKHMLGNRFSIATEAKYYYSSGFIDRNIALLFVGGFRF